MVVNKHTKIKNIIIIYFLLQPFIDVITSLMVYNNLDQLTPGIIIRSSFMLFSLGYAVYLTKNKSEYKFFHYFIMILFIYFTLFLSFIFYQHGFEGAFLEMKSMAKYFYLPITLSSLYIICKDLNIKINFKYFVYVAVSYILLIFIPELTNTNFSSYDNGKLGNIGWFYAANEIGAIIGLLIPILLAYILKEQNKKPLYYSIFMAMIYVALFIGTKVPFLALFITLIVFIIILLIKTILKIKNYNKLLIDPLLLFILILLLLIPSSPVLKNIGIQLDWLKTKQVSGILDIEKENSHLNNMIYSSRDKYLKYRLNQWKQSTSSEKILGLGINENNGNRLVEMDYYDIFFAYGLFGFIIYFIPIIYILKNIIYNYLKKIKDQLLTLDFKLYGYGLVIVFSISIAYFAGHIFSAPAVSIYFILSMISLDTILESRKKI